MVPAYLGTVQRKRQCSKLFSRRPRSISEHLVRSLPCESIVLSNQRTLLERIADLPTFTDAVV